MAWVGHVHRVNFGLTPLIHYRIKIDLWSWSPFYTFDAPHVFLIPSFLLSTSCPTVLGIHHRTWFRMLSVILCAPRLLLRTLCCLLNISRRGWRARVSLIPKIYQSVNNQLHEGCYPPSEISKNPLDQSPYPLKTSYCFIPWKKIKNWKNGYLFWS